MSQSGTNAQAFDIAKEIVVACASNSDLRMDAESGKKIVEFYDEIFKGISKIISESASGNHS